MPRPPASLKTNRQKNQNNNEVTENITVTNSRVATQVEPPTEEVIMGSDEKLEQAVTATLLSETATPVNTTERPNSTKRRQGAAKTSDNPVRAIQPQLFALNNRGEIVQTPSEIPPLTPESSLQTGRWWFRSHLEQLNRPRNTVASYMYDLAGFEELIGDKTLEDINADDVNNFLLQSQKKSTRKRRLTSLGAFFKYLINTEKILEKDPTSNFFADFIPLKTPTVLTLAEQDRLLEAAQRENSRTHLMIYFMVKLGFTRTELLAVQPEHVDVSDPENPLVYVFYDDQRWNKKERKLAAAPEMVQAFQQYIREFQPKRKLFEMLPQSVNKLVERVTREADLSKKVTPQSLRDTFAVEEAKQGANSTKLLLILGLAPDPRNRMSVDRYVKLAVGQ